MRATCGGAGSQIRDGGRAHRLLLPFASCSSSSSHTSHSSSSGSHHHPSCSSNSRSHHQHRRWLGGSPASSARRGASGEGPAAEGRGAGMGGSAEGHPCLGAREGGARSAGVGWRVPHAGQRCLAEAEEYKTRIDDELFAIAVGCHFFSSFCFFSYPTPYTRALGDALTTMCAFELKRENR